MNRSQARRNEILALLRGAGKPLTGSQIAEAVGVSRQVVVQDVALLRAEGKPIKSSASGYFYDEPKVKTRRIKMHHTNDQTEDELCTIVDLGGCVIDVMVNHRVYGKLTAPLSIKTRQDVQRFMEDIRTGKSVPLMNVTSGYHFHLISAESEEALDRIEQMLKIKEYTVPLLPYEKESN